ncbi:uncharacterized protein LOC123684226 [Harmonia axyridis]|uniref:uncharacterized protein LOC123684191 n=1 Tax=Harmonia axyridis TaxID=115357 RepID=UPI001E276A0F|nr:uncharacterized protein LOC123684191 [Harmonia axyridis]XP_045479358.1 uncharacterized protein LOC123684226 [Harmonia axyridis]
MGSLENELAEVKCLCENVVQGSKLVSCVSSMVRVEIKRTQFKKIIVCLYFPREYPNSPILVELKSKTLSAHLLEKLTRSCEKEAEKYLHQPQILIVLKFLRKYIDETPLACCYDEINELKLKLDQNQDEMKLRQKTSSIIFKVKRDRYFLECRIEIPDDYPLKKIEFEEVKTNFSAALNTHIIAQAKEIARKCVEPPLKKNKNEAPFQPTPSLKKTIEFLINCVKNFPQEKCQICDKLCLPENPALLELDEKSPNHIERVYCGHLLHSQCLLDFMKKPPFGNKKCKICGHKLCHFKWTLTDKLAENRWAHEQARERELAEVTDFFN